MSYAQLLARRLQQTQPEGHHVTNDQLHDSLNLESEMGAPSLMDLVN